MLKVYAPLLPGMPHIPLLNPNLGPQAAGSNLFVGRAFVSITEPLVELVDDTAHAQYLLVPHNYSAIRGQMTYLEDIAELSRRHNKKIIVFAHNDLDDEVRLPNAVVFRTSLYRHQKRQNEIAMPAYAEDLLGDDSVTFRAHSTEPPVVGFCGWAEYKNLQNRLGTWVQNEGVRWRSFMEGKPEILSERKGISFRMEALELLKKSPNVRTNFLIRSSYSGHAQTIGMDPVQARREYRENLLNSDLALVIKGDGNYSYRFYEALSLGRVPVLLDTQCVLPMEDSIDYDSFMLRVDFRELSSLDTRIREWWNSLTPEKFNTMQKKAREAFEQQLRIDRFLVQAIDTLGKN